VTPAKVYEKSRIPLPIRSSLNSQYLALCDRCKKRAREDHASGWNIEIKDGGFVKIEPFHISFGGGKNRDLFLCSIDCVVELVRETLTEKKKTTMW
jgi:hypothetical protein